MGSSDTMQGDEGVHTFLKGINPKVKAIVLLEFEPTCYNVVVQYVNNYITLILVVMINGMDI